MRRRNIPANPIVARGEPGEPDADGIHFYGSVIRENGRGIPHVASAVAARIIRACPVDRALASALRGKRSSVHWTKPKLGLVNFLGNKDNNYRRSSTRSSTR